MSLSPDELNEAFKLAQQAQEPLEKPAEPPPFESRFERQGDRAIDKLDNITPEFREKAHGVKASNDNSEASGRNSEMVEKEKPSQEHKPDTEDRKDVDRKAHGEDMRRDDLAAWEANLIRLADDLDKREAALKERDQGMDYGR